MSGNYVGLRCGSSILPHPLEVLGSVTDGCKSGRLIRDIISMFQGVTQWYSLSPTIFNVVLDAVVRNWVEEMVESAGGQGWRG